MRAFNFNQFKEKNGLNAISPLLNEATKFYYSQFGYINELPKCFLFSKSLLETNVDKIIAFLKLFKIDKIESRYFWIGKLYFSLPLAPEWMIISNGTECYEYICQGYKSNFHPCLEYIFHVFDNFRITSQIVSPKKSDDGNFHYYKQPIRPRSSIFNNKIEFRSLLENKTETIPGIEVLNIKEEFEKFEKNPVHKDKNNSESLIKFINNKTNNYKPIPKNLLRKKSKLIFRIQPKNENIEKIQPKIFKKAYQNIFNINFELRSKTVNDITKMEQNTFKTKCNFDLESDKFHLKTKKILFQTNQKTQELSTEISTIYPKEKKRLINFFMSKNSKEKIFKTTNENKINFMDKTSNLFHTKFSQKKLLSDSKQDYVNFLTKRIYLSKKKWLNSNLNIESQQFGSHPTNDLLYQNGSRLLFFQTKKKE